MLRKCFVCDFILIFLLSCSEPNEKSTGDVIVKACINDSNISWYYRVTPLFESGYGISGICDSMTKADGDFIVNNMTQGLWLFEAEGRLESGTVVYRGQTERYAGKNNGAIRIPVTRIVRTETPEGKCTSTVAFDIKADFSGQETCTVTSTATDMENGSTYSVCINAGETDDCFVFAGELEIPSGDYVINTRYGDNRGGTGGFALSFCAVAGETVVISRTIKPVTEKQDNGFVAVSYSSSCISSDSETWSEYVQDNLPGPWNNVTSGDGFYIACGGGVISISQDGTVWHSPLSYNSDVKYMGSCCGNGMLACCSDSGTIAVSSDGKTWTDVVSSDGSKSFRDIIYSNGKFVAAGYVKDNQDLNAVTAFSCNGSDWTICESEKIGSLYCLGASENTFVALGRNGAAAYSTDGDVWNQCSTESSNWLSVTYGDGHFLAVSSDKAAVSEEGINWDVYETGYTSMKSVSYSNGKWIIIRPYNVLVSSSCYGPWTEYECGNTMPLKSVCPVL